MTVESTIVVRVERTEYAVPGWGVGELWTSGSTVLAHDFVFSARAGPPPGTVAANPARLAIGFVSEARQGPSKVQQNGEGEPCIDVARPASGSDNDPARLADDLVDRFRGFLRGDDVGFADIALDQTTSTSFQVAVADVLRDVPRGEVVCYGELAALAGYPRAGRAVGTFCARNRFTFVVPCHRVVASNGIGSYGSAGVGIKRRLLMLEGVRM